MKIIFDTEDAYYADYHYPNSRIANTLRAIADKVEEGQSCGVVRAGNGNSVGTFDVKHNKPKGRIKPMTKNDAIAWLDAQDTGFCRTNQERAKYLVGKLIAESGTGSALLLPTIKKEKKMKNKATTYQFAINSETCRIPKVSAVFVKDETNNWGGEDEKGWPAELLEEGASGYVFDDEWSYFEGTAEECIEKAEELGTRNSSHWMKITSQLWHELAMAGVD